MTTESREEPLAHDAAGNLVYDGLHAYAYDAWGRLATIHRAYRDPDNNDELELGAQIQHNRYDGLGRRIARETMNTPRNIAKDYVYAGQSVVEVQVSGYPIRHMLWAGTFGGGYIDELIQVGLTNPADFEEESLKSVHVFFWAVHNANYNVMAMIDDFGNLAERYEYTPYGERQIYVSNDPCNDPHAMTPVGESPRWQWTEVVPLTLDYGLNPVGHQGLLHDGTGSATGGGTSLVYNRARHLHVRLGRFVQRDPLRYVDAMSLYLYVMSDPVGRLDPHGQQTFLDEWTDKATLLL
ncbi:MAG: RHS repeat-associated core domain-containing protein [Phycisphaeraceae bacterium]